MRWEYRIVQVREALLVDTECSELRIRDSALESKVYSVPAGKGAPHRHVLEATTDYLSKLGDERWELVGYAWGDGDFLHRYILKRPKT